MLELADLRVFVLIQEWGSISGAARALGMPKSSASRALAKLEKDLGVPLMERSTRHLRATDAGQLLLEHARRILSDVANAEDAVIGLLGEPQGDLNVVAPLTFALGPILHLIPSLVARFPRLRVAVTVDDGAAPAVPEPYDVVVCTGPLTGSGLIARKLASYSMWLCASPDYLGRHGSIVAKADLTSHLLVSTGEGARAWDFSDDAGVLGGLHLQSRIAMHAPDAVRSLVEGGTGIGLLPDFMVAPAVLNGRLRRLLPDEDFGTVEAHVLYAGHRSLSPKLRVFIDALVETMREGETACKKLLPAAAA